MSRGLLALGLVALAGCAGLPDPDQRRLRIFDRYWQALREDYPYFGRKGID